MSTVHTFHVTRLSEILDWLATEFEKSRKCTNRGKLNITFPCFPSSMWELLFPPQALDPLGWDRHFTRCGREIIHISTNWDSLNWLFGEDWHQVKEPNTLFYRRLMNSKGIKFSYDIKSLRLRCQAYVVRYNRLN